MTDKLVEILARAILKAELEREAVAMLAEGKAGEARELSAAVLSGVESHWRTRSEEAQACVAAVAAAGLKVVPAA